MLFRSPVPRIVKLDPPTPPKRVRPAEKPPQTELKLDEVAKLLEQKKAQLKPDVPTPAPTPKPAAVKPAPTPARTYDPNSIAKLLSHDKPQQTAAAAPEVTQTASIGAPNASAAKMSPTLMAALDGLMMDQYNQCWTDNGIGANGYVPQIRVQYAPDGSLIGPPTLTNPTADPALKSLADDALRAIRKCNPLKIPAQYAPYYEQWRQRLLRMNPEDRTG